MKFGKKSKRSTKKGTYHLRDLKSSLNLNNTESIYVEFKPPLKKIIFKSALNTFETITNLSRISNISFTQLWDQFTRVPFSLSNLQKISNLLVNAGCGTFTLLNLEKNIYYIKSGGSHSQKIYYPVFPISFNTKEGMRFLSHLYHDGCIGKDNKQPRYVNKSKPECSEFLSDSQILFGKFKREIKKDKKGIYRITLPTIVGEIMISIGYTPGYKIKIHFQPFSFLEKIDDKELISEFLAKAFNDDGCVGKREITLEQASLIKNGTPAPSGILEIDKLLLNKLGIKVQGPYLTNTYMNRYGKCSKYIIRITSKPNLKLFNKHIKLMDYKRKKLESYLDQ